MRLPSRDFWTGRKVLVTGHTGFKGAWLVMLLNRLGAKVSGFSLPKPVTLVSLFEAARLTELCEDLRGDIRDLSALAGAIQRSQPEIVIHMAAQPIVLSSLADPIGTFETNVIGTANLLQAARDNSGLRVALSVTSDKCYENFERVWPYRETEAMGGSDPYSASKGCAELVTAAFAKTYYRTGGTRVISGRAGNVIGGGDWAEYRLIPDLVRAIDSGLQVEIRNPSSIRPWQFVLDPLIGYLLAIEHAEGGDLVHDAWNFGPNAGEELPVRAVVEVFQSHFAGKPTASFALETTLSSDRSEAGLLRVDATKAKAYLGWRPALNGAEAIAYTAEWYKAFIGGRDARELSFEQIERLTAI